MPVEFVYVVSDGVVGEGEEIHAIHATPDAAIAFAVGIAKQHGCITPHAKFDDEDVFAYYTTPNETMFVRCKQYRVVP